MISRAPTARELGPAVSRGPALGPTLALPPAPGLLSAPLWRREPYRIFFPLGALLTWAAVSHWLLLALRFTDTYLSIFHAMTQVQGFLTCYAVGFLFTFIPRRTGTSPPAPWQMAVAIAAPVMTSALAFTEHWAASQLPWIILLLTVVGFAARRARSAGGARRGAPSFVWVPLTLVIALLATLLTGAAAAGAELMWLHDLGRSVVLQGTFTGLALGIGSMLIPVITRGEPPRELRPGEVRRTRAWHLVAAAVFFAAFWVEARLSVRAGFALRAASSAAVLWFAARAWRRPTLPGLHRRLILIAVWCIPAGNALVALFPEYRQAGLHVLFIGGFALLTLVVSAHVALTHGGRAELLRGRPWPAVAMVALLALALAARILVVVDQTRFYLWLGIAASAFLAATVAWAMLFTKGLERMTQAAA
jgi:uncharacterized protein involved in response to NO